MTSSPLWRCALLILATAAAACDGNHETVVVPDFAAVDEDGTVSVRILDNDLDSDADPLTVYFIDAGGHDAGFYEGAMIVTPTPDFNGTLEVDYQIYDGTTSTPGLLTVEVRPVADPPFARAQYVDLDPGTGIDFDLDAGDVDGDSVSTRIVTAPAGTLTRIGETRFRYQPVAGFTGDDQFVYEVSDGVQGARATVHLWVH